METKICASCKEEKPISCFSRNRNEKDGYKCYCNPSILKNENGALLNIVNKHANTERGVNLTFLVTHRG